MSLVDPPGDSIARQAAGAARSAHCNGALIKHCREQQGWTQIDLAVRAGFSRRLVAKAEAGGPLDLVTIDVMATALSEGEITVTSTDLLCDPELLTRRFLANYGKYEADWVEHSRDIISPDIVAYIDGDPAANPIAGEYVGIDAFAQIWKTFFAIFVRDGGTLNTPEMVVAGNDVVEWGHELIRVPEAPPQPPGLVLLKLHYENGTLVRLEDYYETSGMMRALQRWVDEYPDGDWTKLLNVGVIKAIL